MISGTSSLYNNFFQYTSDINKNDFYLYEEIYEKNTTLMYRPPEMIDLYLRFPVNQQVDIWMLGCILYILCFYRHPFQEASKLAIISAGYFLPDHNYSPGLISLMSIMLAIDPRKRITAKELTLILEEYQVKKRITVKEELLTALEGNFKGKEVLKERRMKKEGGRERKIAIKQPLVDFTNEWGDFVKAEPLQTKKSERKSQNNSIQNKKETKDIYKEGNFDFNFSSLGKGNENILSNSNNQWDSAAFMGFAGVRIPTSPKMEDMEERKTESTVLKVPFLKLQSKRK